MAPCRGYNKVKPGCRPQEVEVSASVLYMSMSLDGYIAGPNDDLATPVAMASAGCTIGSSLQVGSSSGVWAGRAVDRRMECDRCSPRRPTTAEQIDHWKVTLTASRSSCPVTGRRVLRWRIIRW